MATTRTRIPTVEQVSSGGVAYRRIGNRLQVVLISVGEAQRWQLPKGTVEKNESHESAAVREVREETGIHSEVVRPLDRIEYWFQSSTAGKRIRHHKFVYFYLMRALSGDTTDHDDEVNESRWVEFTAALKMLTFENERRILRAARAALRKH